MTVPSISIMAELAYEQPEAALAWLERAFGLATQLRVFDAGGRLVFSTLGQGERIAVLPAGRGGLHSPRSADGRNTQGLHLTITEPLEAHYARAKAVGAEILAEPQGFFFGATYTAADLEGHPWTFRQHDDGPARALPEGWRTVFGPVGAF